MCRRDPTYWQLPDRANTLELSRWKVLGIVLSVAAVLGLTYWYNVDQPYLGDRLALHRQILEGRAQSPYRYRVLVPLLAEAMIRPASGLMSHDRAFLLAYAAYDLAAIGLFLMALMLLLRQWFTVPQSLLGVLFVSSTLPVAFHQHYFQPWSLLEAGLFAAALLAIWRKRHLLTGALVVAATLNRETGLFIPLLFLCGNCHVLKGSVPRPTAGRRTVLLFIAYLALWAGTYGGLRYALGPAPHVHTVGEIWRINVTGWRLALAAVNWSLLLGVFWLFAVRGLKCAPPFIRRASLVVPMYLATIGVFGVWAEVRLLMPMYGILLPLALSYLYPVDREIAGSRPS